MQLYQYTILFFFKAGTPSATYDVMINTAYFKKCQEKKHFKGFTTLVILSGVADKFNKDIDTENYIILKNRTVSICKGYHKHLSVRTS